MDVTDLDDGTPAPRMWHVAPGVAYAELAPAANVRPPLLSEWESEQVAAMGDQERRQRWLAGRTLAKALVRVHTGRSGIVDVRDGGDGRPLLFDGGLPAADTWIGMVRRSDRIAVSVSDRPVGIATRRPVDAADDRSRSVISRRELRGARIIFRDAAIARALVWAMKDAAIDALRARTTPLAAVHLENDLCLSVNGTTLRPLAVRVRENAVTVLVGPARPGDPDGPMLIVDPAVDQRTAGYGVRDALDRQLARARRVLDARARAGRAGWQPS